MYMLYNIFCFICGARFLACAYRTRSNSNLELSHPMPWQRRRLWHQLTRRHVLCGGRLPRRIPRFCSARLPDISHHWTGASEFDPSDTLQACAHLFEWELLGGSCGGAGRRSAPRGKLEAAPAAQDADKHPPTTHSEFTVGAGKGKRARVDHAAPRDL